MKTIKSKLRNLLCTEWLEGYFAFGQIPRKLCAETAENYSRTSLCLKKYDSLLLLCLQPSQDCEVYKLTLAKRCSLLSLAGQGRSQISELNGGSCSPNLITCIRKIAKSNY